MNIERKALTYTKSNVVDTFITRLKSLSTRLPDRRTGQNIQYTLDDIVLGAFAVFLLQCPSFLARQQALQRRKGRSNAASVFHMTHTPCDAHIRQMLDPIAPEYFYPEFHALLGAVTVRGHLAAYRVWGMKHLLLSLDGTEYFSSYALHCANCSARTRRNGQVEYYHSALLPVIVAPGNPRVLPVPLEYIIPQDGYEKQDCERAASKRWVTQHVAQYVGEKALLLGDDLYANQPLCEHILAYQLHFLFVCKPDSHTTLYTALAQRTDAVDTYTVRKWNGQPRERWTYRYCLGLPLRAGDDALRVNWCKLQITRLDTGKTSYHHTWVTDLPLTADNLAEMVSCARAPWKIENENNNVLKTKGYHLEHNFGHGQQHLAMTLLTLNLLAFLLHTVTHLTNKIYQRLRKALGRRAAFFNAVRALLRYFLFNNWTELLHFMAVQLEIDPAPA